jgi:hypothetical protein
MPISLAQLAGDIRPAETVLLFGAGSSVPSKAPSVRRIIDHLAAQFHISGDGYTLTEISGIIEHKTSRRRLITELRTLFKDLRPTGGLVNLPLYDWKSLYTTNYDHLIEACYEARQRDIITYSSNFDFTLHSQPNAVKLFKLHGTIEKDTCDGHQSRIIITESDYDHTADYREQLFDRLKGDLAGSRLIIIGHSLADPDIRSIVNRAAEINLKAQAGGEIVLLLFQRDEDRAALFESRGIRVCFGGIDEFFSALATQQAPATALFTPTGASLDEAPALRPVTIDVAHAANKAQADVSAMFNG